MIARVAVPITNLYRNPSLHSECLNQALFNESIQILDQTDRWVYVQLLRDQYRGWLSRQHVVWDGLPQTRFAFQINAAQTPFYNDEKQLGYLFFGTRLNGQQNGFRFQFSHPFYGTVYCAFEDIVSIDSCSFSLEQLTQWAHRFVGIPYLWGGISPMGFDCSGFIQTLYGFFQISLPRDSTPQRQQLPETSSSHIGDLAFFPGHVAFMLDSQSFIHANFHDNRVFYGSFDPQSPYFRNDLTQQLQGFRRVVENECAQL